MEFITTSVNSQCQNIVTKWEKASDISFNGIKVQPKALFFKNLMEGKCYRQKIVLQNTVAKPVVIRTIVPQACSFKLENPHFGTSLPSGLSINLWIRYTHVQNSNVTATLRIYVDEECLNYPINVCMSFNYIYPVPRVINFGKINLAYSIYTETLSIHNKGFKTSKFAFDLASNPLGLLVKPAKGFIEPNSVTNVEISIVGIEEGQFHKEIWVKCDYPFRFAVSVDIVKPKLYICSPQVYTDFFLPIQFPPMYATCKNYKTIVINNHNLLESNYIVVPEFHLDVMALHKVKELEPSYTSFNFLPAVDGHLKPNEKKELNITFQPKYLQPQKSDRVFFVCYRLIRLEIVNVNRLMLVKAQKKAMSVGKHTTVTDTNFIEASESDVISWKDMSEDTRSHSQMFGETFVNNYELNTNKNFSEFVRLCLYAVVKPVQVDVQPTRFQLGSMQINCSKTFIITLTNRSNTLPIYFQYNKTAYIDVVPEKGKLGVSQSIEFSVNISPKRPGILDSEIKFNLLYNSYIVGKEKELVKVGKVVVSVQMNVFFPIPVLKPKFNLGITPKLCNEVGYLTDDIRFNTDVVKPKMAMLGCYDNNPSKKKDNAKIAFPNDRPTALAPWKEKNIKCKTVFAGIPRCIAPPDNYTLTSQERFKKQKNIDYYDRYLEKMQIKRLEREPPKMLPDYYTAETKLLLKINKPICAAYAINLKNPIHDGFPALTPSQTYFIHVKPLKVNLGKVAVNSTSIFCITVVNDNKFPVHVELKTLHMDESVFPSLPKTTVLKGSLNTTFEEIFRPNLTGRFHTILNVFINNRHSLPITFQADIMRPFVHLETHSIIFDDKDGGSGRYVQLLNILNSPVNYFWQVPKLTCYKVRPAQGCIPVGRFIMCEVAYKPDAMKRTNARLQCCSQNGNTSVLEVNAYLLKCDVEYLKEKINVDYVPLNIPIIEYNVLRNNASESVSFIIRNTKPCYGVTIEPAFGTIWGRSDFHIKVILHLKFFAKFECRVETEFDHGNFLTFIVSGNVDFPKLRFRPDQKLNIKRIPAESFDVCPFSVQNKSNSEINVTFDETLFPDVKISQFSDYLDAHEELEISLAPDEITELFVHFYPLDVCMNDFFLPIVINHILGPPYKGEPETLKASMYTDEFIPPGIHLDENIKIIKNKLHVLPTLSINAISSRHVLRFNKTFFKFKYFPLKSYPSKTTQELKIKNSFIRCLEFSIHLNSIFPHFEIIPHDYKAWTLFNNFMYCALEPNEEIILTIKFKPVTPGLVMKRLEVFIKDVKNANVFTFIRLRARFLDASINIPMWIFLEPVPLRIILEHEVKLKLRNHMPNCKLIIICEDKDFMITEMPNELDYSLMKDVKVKIEFLSDVVKQVCAKVYFTCSCGAEAHTIVTASADDNIATIYTHYHMSAALFPSVVKSKYFPLFPSKAEKTKLAIYMRNCKKIVERWVYEQALHMTFYYFIPDSMMGLYKYNSRQKNNRLEMLTLVKIMINICGPDVLSSIINRLYPINGEQTEQINYKHATFKNIIMFLKAHGAFFPHVRARFLLEYNEYTIYCTKIRTIKQKTPIEYDEFDEHYLRSEQCWLDLILQLFKTLVLSTITFRKHRISHVSDTETFERVQNSDSQQALLQWLNDIYENQIDNLMDLDYKRPSDFYLGSKHITNFTSDLQDGLVLTAITIYYCPYLKYILKDIYVKIDSPDKSYHNAVLLTKAWSMVKCSFKILPEEISNPYALQMLMFVTYLYLVFPLLIPKEELTFNVSLSFTETREIVLKNPSSMELHFEISFLNNQMDCFQILPCNLAIVPATKDMKLKISYRAKTMENVNAVLVLSGDTPGQTYCKSLIYILTGITNFAKEHENIILSVDLYSMVDRDILIQAPYTCETTYELVKDKCKLQDFNLEVFHSWKQNHLTIVPKSLYCRDCMLVTNELGIGTVRMTLCCLSRDLEELVLVFLNKEIGDFIITVTLQPINFSKIPKHQIVINLPENWDDELCICSKNKFVNNKKCPRYVTINIPCRNDHFWNIIIKSLIFPVPEHEKSIWIEYLNGEMGPYLLNWLLVTANQPYSSVTHIFDSDIKYKLVHHAHNLQFPASVIIPNMRSKEYVSFQVHVGYNTISNKVYEFSLQPEGGGEYRIYALSFIKKNFNKSIKSNSDRI